MQLKKWRNRQDGSAEDSICYPELAQQTFMNFKATISFRRKHPVDHYILKWQCLRVLVSPGGQSISILAKPVGPLEYRIIAYDATGSQCQILRNNRSIFPELHPSIISRPPLSLSFVLAFINIYLPKNAPSIFPLSTRRKDSSSALARTNSFLPLNVRAKGAHTYAQHSGGRISGSSIRRADVTRP